MLRRALWVALFVGGATFLLAACASALATSFDAILGCVKAQTCPNMTASKAHWADMLGIPVMVFSEDGTTYALSAGWGQSDGRLRIHVTLPGDKTASRSLTVGSDDKVVSGELGPQPGDVQRPTSEDLVRQFETHKVYDALSRTSSPPSRGDEFKAFWQEQATAAMAAIRKQIAK